MPTQASMFQTELNQEQQLAVGVKDGCYAVVAGPGSGKTFVLTKRYKKLLDSGIKPEEILCLTFTKSAANEMKKRANAPENPRVCGFMTFHSLALSFATIERDAFPFKLAPNPLAIPGQVYKIASESLRRSPDIDLKYFLSWMSRQKRSAISPTEAQSRAKDALEKRLATAYQEYEIKCRKLGVLDFDDLLLQMLNILGKHSEVNARWQYRYLQIDEAQDADIIQWAIVKELSGLNQNVFAVGDANQNIYEWRGTEAKLFQEFHSLFLNAKYLYLGQNYRSTPQLVSFIKEIAPIKNELIDRFRSENLAGPDVEIYSYGTNIQEAESVVKRIIEIGEKTNIAILSRTNRYLGPYESFLTEKNVRYRLLGKSGFFHQPEIKNVLSFVQIAAMPIDSAVLTAVRSPFPQGIYLRRKELFDALKGQKIHRQDSVWSILQNYKTPDTQQNKAISDFTGFLNNLRFRYSQQNVPSSVVTGIIGDLSAGNYYAENELSEIDNSAAENLQELVRIAGRFSTIKEFLDHVRKVNNASRAKKGVCLSTIHGAKGLEFETVFLVGCQEGHLPHTKGKLGEEQRIFFVGASRPERRLIISYYGQPSRFLAPFIKKPETVVQ